MKKRGPFFFKSQLVWEKTQYFPKSPNVALQLYEIKFLVCFKFFFKSITVWKKMLFLKPTKRSYNSSLAAHGALAHCLQYITTVTLHQIQWCHSQTSKMMARSFQNGRQGHERGLIIGYWALQSTFDKYVFLFQQQ